MIEASGRPQQVPETLPILLPDEEQDRFRGRLKPKDVPIDALRASLAEFVAGMDHALGAVPRAMRGYQVEEVTLSLEVGASGKVSMIGTGAEVSGKGAITLTLKRAAGAHDEP